MRSLKQNCPTKHTKKTRKALFIFGGFHVIMCIWWVKGVHFQASWFILEIGVEDTAVQNNLDW